MRRGPGPRIIRWLFYWSVLAVALRNLSVTYFQTYFVWETPNQSSARSVRGDGQESFFWEKADNCHAVDDVCHVRGRLDRWFYFEDDSNSRSSKHQPSLELAIVDHEGLLDNDVVNNVYFGVSSSLPRPTLSQLRKHERKRRSGENNSTTPHSNCDVSPVANHIVLQSLYNGMVGEFYSRTLLPVNEMMLRLEDDEIDDGENPRNDDFQFYVHLMEGGKTLLDAHALFLNGLHPGNTEAEAWASMFDQNATGEGAPPECQCYRRFVLCGYVPLHEPGERCRDELSDLALGRKAAKALCDAGLTLKVLNELRARSALDRRLRDLGLGPSRRSEVVRAVGDAPPANVAVDMPASSSSHRGFARPSYAFDGNAETKWESERADGQYLEVDLGSRHRIREVVISWENAAAERYDVQVSNDGKSWTTEWSKADGKEGMGTVESRLGQNVTGRYVRMQGHERATDW